MVSEEERELTSAQAEDVENAEPAQENAKPEEASAETVSCLVTVNGETVELRGKESYIFVDIFDWITFDLNAGRGRAIATMVNGMDAEFSQPLHEGDRIELYWKE